MMFKPKLIHKGNASIEEYYTEDEALQESEYYSPDKDHGIAPCRWRGNAAKMLELEGVIKPSIFKKVFYGHHPQTGKRLRKAPTTSKERLAADLTFSPGKEASILALIGGDRRIDDLHQQALEHVFDIFQERYAQTRVRNGNGSRLSVNTNCLVGAFINHGTARPVELDGKTYVDPYLHTHVVVMNTTYVDGKWQSLKNDAIFQSQSLGSIYKAYINKGLAELGYTVRHDGSIEGLSQQTVKHFQKRTQEAERYLKKHGLEDTQENRQKAVLRTRRLKENNSDIPQRMREWKVELAEHGFVLPAPGAKSTWVHQPEQTRHSIDSAIRHLQERSAQFTHEEIEQWVLDQNPPITFDDLQKGIAKHPELIKTQNNTYTTQYALDREEKTRQLWADGEHKFTPITTTKLNLSEKLNAGQRAAIRGTLASANRVVIWHGLSGVGKTTTLSELQKQLQIAFPEVDIRGYSPTTKAAEVLSQELGIEATTVDGLITRKLDTGSHQWWIVDEAGMMSAEQGLELLRRAKAVNARILLVGDTNQNSSVNAGSVMRSLMVAGAEVYHIKTILRQTRNIQRRAVELVASKKPLEALTLLHEYGHVKEVADRRDRAAQIAQKYLSLKPKERKQTLIVTGTHRERRAITALIREGLRKEGTITGEDQTIRQLVDKRLTTEQTRHLRYYQPGDYVMFNKQYATTRLKPGELYKVVAVDEVAGVVRVVSKGGQHTSFDPAKYQKKTVFSDQKLDVAVGDVLRWTRNNPHGTNGVEFKVTAIENHRIQINHKLWIDTTKPLELDHAMTSTTHAAQGQTAKRVIFSCTIDPTSSREPFYVAISRQRDELYIFTENYEDLCRQVQRSAAQLNPRELLGLDEDLELPEFTQSAFWTPQTAMAEPPKSGIALHHWEELIEGSGIHPDLIELNCRSLQGDVVYEYLLEEKIALIGTGQIWTTEMQRLRNRVEHCWDGGFWIAAGVDAQTLDNPLLSNWGSFKPDHPRYDNTRERFQKYEHPQGTGRRIFLAEVPDWFKEHIYKQYDIIPAPEDHFWKIVRDNPRIPIHITEGGKKTLSITSQGHVVIGLPGVNAGYRAKDDQDNKLPERILNPDLAVFAVPGRKISFLYDQDTQPSTVANVRRDLVRTGTLLEAKGCSVSFCKWNSLYKGADDLIVGAEPELLEFAIEAARPLAIAVTEHYKHQYEKLYEFVMRRDGELPRKVMDLEIFIEAYNRGITEDAYKTIEAVQPDLDREKLMASALGHQEKKRSAASAVVPVLEQLAKTHGTQYRHTYQYRVDKWLIASGKRGLTVRDTETGRVLLQTKWGRLTRVSARPGVIQLFNATVKQAKVKPIQREQQKSRKLSA
jgi:conjugative relaxase-like TrwC/TraI family protein